MACLKKPVSKKDLDEAFANIKSRTDGPPKQLLIVEDNALEREQVVRLVAHQSVQITAVGTGADALAALRVQRFDCLVLDLRLPDVSGLELVEKIRQELNLLDLPVIVYTGKELTAEDETRLRGRVERVIAKDARSLDRLREETVAFLHRVAAGHKREETSRLLHRIAADSSRSILHAPPAPKTAAGLAGKKILVVDDDVRNLFALMSMLEQFQLQVLRAESGPEALQTLEQQPDVDLVLMDIMMPGMDGYETTRAIRRQERFQSLPVVALTAKAMKGDREKCLGAGTSDYLAKPVSSEQLFTVLNTWLSHPQEAEAAAR